MERKLKICFIFLLFLSLSTAGKGQDTMLLKIIEKNLMRSLDVPSEFLQDPCFYSNTLLKIKMSKNSEVTSLVVSDNAASWITNQAEKIKERINLELIKNLPNSRRLREKQFIIPVIIRADLLSCTTTSGFFWFKDNYFSFNGEKLQGDFIFSSSVNFMLSSFNH